MSRSLEDEKLSVFIDIYEGERTRFKGKECLVMYVGYFIKKILFVGRIVGITDTVREVETK